MRFQLILSTLFLILQACTSAADKKEFNNVVDTNEIVFKRWVRDTLPSIKTKDSLFFSEVSINDDTTLMEIKKHYKLKVVSVGNYNNSDLVYAFSLLEREHLLPTTPFSLNLDVNYIYIVSFVGTKYDYKTEIGNFEVITEKEVMDLSYVKGNLVDKKIKKRT